MKHKGDGDSNRNRCTRYSHQWFYGLVQGQEDLEIRVLVESIQLKVGEIGQNTKKSLGELRRLAVAKTPADSH